MRRRPKSDRKRPVRKYSPQDHVRDMNLEPRWSAGTMATAIIPAVGAGAEAPPGPGSGQDSSAAQPVKPSGSTGSASVSGTDGGAIAGSHGGGGSGGGGASTLGPTDGTTANPVGAVTDALGDSQVNAEGSSQGSIKPAKRMGSGAGPVSGRRGGGGSSSRSARGRSHFAPEALPTSGLMGVSGQVGPSATTEMPALPAPAPGSGTAAAANPAPSTPAAGSQAPAATSTSGTATAASPTSLGAEQPGGTLSALPVTSSAGFAASLTPNLSASQVSATSALTSDSTAAPSVTGSTSDAGQATAASLSPGSSLGSISLNTSSVMTGVLGSGSLDTTPLLGSSSETGSNTSGSLAGTATTLATIVSPSSTIGTGTTGVSSTWSAGSTSETGSNTSSPLASAGSSMGGSLFTAPAGSSGAASGAFMGPPPSGGTITPSGSLSGAVGIQTGGTGVAPDQPVSSGLFSTRPTGGGIGGLTARAWDQQTPTPFTPLQGSGQEPNQAGTAAFSDVNSLIVRYVDAYFASLNYATGSGPYSNSYSVTDSLGTYTFSFTATHNYQLTSTTLANDYESFSFSFSESGTAADGTTFTLIDHGVDSDTQTGTLVASGHTLTSSLSATQTYNLSQTLTLSAAPTSQNITESITTSDSGQSSFSYSETRTEAYSGGILTGGTNTYTFDQAGFDHASEYSSSKEVDTNSSLNGTLTVYSQSQTIIQTSTLTATSTLSLHLTATDNLGSLGFISSGTRSLSETTTETLGGTTSDATTESSSDTDGTTSGTLNTTFYPNESYSLSTTGTEHYADQGNPGASYTWTGTASDAVHSILTYTLSGTETLTFNSTLDGVTGHETLTWAGTDSISTTAAGGHLTMTLSMTGTEALGASNTVASGNDGYTWYATQTLTVTTTQSASTTLTDYWTNSSTLGGVTLSDTVTVHDRGQPTITQVGAVLNFSLAETGTDSRTTGGLVSSGNFTAWLSQTETAPTSLYETGLTTITESNSQNSTLGGVTTHEQVAFLGTATTTETDTATDTPFFTLTISDSLTVGAVVSSGKSSDSLYQAPVTHTGSLYETQNNSVGSTTTESSTLGGVTTSQSVTTTQSLFPTTTDTAKFTQTYTHTDSLNANLGTLVSGGSYDSSYETGTDNSSLYETGTEISGGLPHGTVGFTAGDSATQVSILAGVTTGVSQSSGFSDNITVTESGIVTSTDLATSTLTLGSDGLISGGSATGSLNTVGRPNYSIIETGTALEYLNETQTAAVAGITSSESLGSTDSLTSTATDAGSFVFDHGVERRAHDLLRHVHVHHDRVAGAGGAATAGYASSTLTEPGTDSTTLYETGSVTVTSFAQQVGASGGDLTSMTLGSQTTDTPTLTESGNVAEHLSAMNTVTFGLKGALTGGNSTNSIQEVGSASYSLSDSGVDFVSQTNSDSSAESANSGYETLYSGYSDHHTTTEAWTLYPSATATETAVLAPPEPSPAAMRATRSIRRGSRSSLIPRLTPTRSARPLRTIHSARVPS